MIKKEFIMSVKETEEKHGVCKELLENVKNGKYIGVEPFTVLVEVVAAIRRRTGNEEPRSKLRGINLD